MNIYVGNLPYSIDRDELKETFAAFGDVATARIVTDRETNRSKGFGFVEMPNDAEARQAIEALNGQDLGGRKAVVNEARPREERPRTGGFGGERPRRRFRRRRTLVIPAQDRFQSCAAGPEVSGRLSFFRISSGPLLHSAGSGCILIGSFCD